YARKLAWACIAASVLGNAGQHGMEAYGVVPPWYVVVAVSAVPPAMLGAVVHLGHLIGRGRVEESGEDTVEPEPHVEEQGVEEPVVAEPQPEEKPEPQRRRSAAVEVDEQRLAELIAAGAGRRTIAKELGISVHKAR